MHALLFIYVFGEPAKITHNLFIVVTDHGVEVFQLQGETLL